MRRLDDAFVTARTERRKGRFIRAQKADNL